MCLKKSCGTGNKPKSLPSLHSPVSIRCAMSCPLCFHPDTWVCPPLCRRGRITLRSIRQLCMTPGLATRMYARHFLSNHAIMANEHTHNYWSFGVSLYFFFHLFCCIFKTGFNFFLEVSFMNLDACTTQKRKQQQKKSTSIVTTICKTSQHPQSNTPLFYFAAI